MCWQIPYRSRREDRKGMAAERRGRKRKAIQIKIETTTTTNLSNFPWVAHLLAINSDG